MFLAIEQLRELIKSFTVAQTVADATSLTKDKEYANKLLDEINAIRLNLAIQAEMREVFYSQINFAQAASVTQVNSQWFTKSDKEYIVRRGIASLDEAVTVSLLNQGNRQKVITREPVAWQNVFSGVQSGGLGQADVFDLPEALRFGKNQSLNIAVTGQSVSDGFVFLHGATIKNNLTDAAVNELRSEFIDQNGKTKYLPETQLVPIIYQFPSNVADTYATDINGGENIYSVKNDRSVLLLKVSVTGVDARIDKLIDEGRNHTFCDRIELEGVASLNTNQFTTYYDLPYPHLLRAGDRLRAVVQNGSNISGATQDADVNNFLVFLRDNAIMIDIVNTQYLTREQRMNSVTRAIHSQPFFNLLQFELIAAANDAYQFAAKADVDKDFYITQLKGNFNEVFEVTNAQFGLNTYIANKGYGLLRYTADELVPSSFQVTNCQTLEITNPLFDNRQFETMPILIKRGQSVVASARNLSAKADVADIQIVLAGYYVEPEAYLANRSLEGVNESLAKDIEFDQFKFDVDFDGNGVRILNNDRFARMVLGFTIVNKNAVGTNDTPNSTVLITDVYRNIKFNNEPINIGFFAPKINQVTTSHIYYLPVEYFWQPFAPLKFEIVNELLGGDGYELVMLTRTV